MYASNYFEELMLNLMRGQAITAPSRLYLGLFLSNPGDTGTGGTEVNYSGYQRQQISFSAPATAGSGLRIQNSAEITFPESPSDAGTVTYIGVFDAQSNGNMLLYAQLSTALAVQPGVSPVFRAGSIKWTWSGNLSTYYRRAIMNTLRGTSLAGFSPYLALCNGDPTGSGSEFSGGNYARIACTMSAPTQQASGAAMSQNSARVDSNASTAAWGNLNAIAVYDAASSGNAFCVINLDVTYSLISGASVGIKAGRIQVSIN